MAQKLDLSSLNIEHNVYYRENPMKFLQLKELVERNPNNYFYELSRKNQVELSAQISNSHVIEKRKMLTLKSLTISWESLMKISKKIFSALKTEKGLVLMKQYFTSDIYIDSSLINKYTHSFYLAARQLDKLQLSHMTIL